MVMFSGEATLQRFGFTQCRIFGAQSTITFDAADTVEDQARFGSSRGVAWSCGVFLPGRAAGSGGGVANYMDEPDRSPQELKYHSSATENIWCRLKHHLAILP